MVYGKDTDLEKQHLLLSAQHVKIYPSGHHFSPKLPPALEGKVPHHLSLFFIFFLFFFISVTFYCLAIHNITIR